MLFSSKYLVFPFVLIALIIGGFASSNTGEDIWYINLNKSSLNPPGYIFGIVWPILYILMSISAYLTFNDTFRLFIAQLFFNTAWSWLFFYFHMPIVSLLDIFLLIFLNLYILRKMLNVNYVAAYLYIPYLIWLSFAFYLNLYIVINK